MAGRHSLHAVVLFAVILHAIAISQTLLPAQDGLKFIRVAREFQSHPWDDVIRASDIHPLYPALIAAVQPAVAWFTGPGPAAWRTAAQIVAVLASIGLIVPIYGLTRMLFDRRIACMAAALAVLLPRAAELGHDTLSDSLGLLCTFLALWLGARAICRGDWRLARLPGSRPAPATWRGPKSVSSRVQSRLSGWPVCSASRRSPDRLRAGTRGVAFGRDRRGRILHAGQGRDLREAGGPTHGLARAETRKSRSTPESRCRVGSTTRAGTFLPRKRASEFRSTAWAMPSAASSANGGRSFAGCLRS